MTGTTDDSVHVVLCVDDRYVDPMLATARSVRHALPPTRDVVFHLLDGGLGAAGADAARRLAAVGRTAFHPIPELLPLRADHATAHPQYAWWSSAILGRLHLAQVMPADVHRVLYLDADTVAREDVARLYDTDLDGLPVAAVAVERLPSDWEHLLSTLTPAPARHATPPYFNSGVLLIDLDRWREQRIGDEATELYLRHQDQLRSPDQDALNLVLEGRWQPLDAKWNKLVQHHRRDPFGLERMDYYARPEGILHFGGQIKPWHDDYPATPLRSIYRAFDR